MKPILPKIQLDRATIRAFFKTDRGVFLISIGVAFLFWFVIKLSQKYEAKRIVEVSYELPDNRAYIALPPEKLDIVLEGQGWDLMMDYFNNRSRAIHFDLSASPLQNISNNQIRSKINEQITSNDIGIKEIEKDFITIETGENSRKKVPVTFQGGYTFAQNFQLRDALQLTPDSIWIGGPTTIVDEITEWPTVPLNLTDLRTTVRQPLALEIPSLAQLDLSSEVIRVEIPVEQYTEKSIFLPVVIKNAPDSFKVFPQTVKTHFVVGLSRYDSIGEKDFQLEVDLQGVPINQVNNTAPIILAKQPKVVKSVNFSPKSVKFLFVKEAE